jgi:hypothetical protein
VNFVVNGITITLAQLDNLFIRNVERNIPESNFGQVVHLFLGGHFMILENYAGYYVG